MSNNLELALRIRADVNAARNALNAVDRQIARIGNTARRPFADPTRALVAGATQATNALRGMSRAIFSVQGALVGLGAGFVAKGFLDASRELENIQVRMRFLTGSTQQAAEATQLLVQYAQRSPATLQQITAAAPNLLVAADNLDELNRLLQITGDLSAVSGLSFQETAEQIQRAMSAGAASADLFQQRGVNAMLGFQAGVSVSAEETKRIIMDLWFGPGSATNTLRGAASEMANTWDGLVSMQIDRWDQFRRTVMDAGPFEFLKAAMQELDAAMAANFGSIEEAGRQMGNGLVVVFQDVAISAARLLDNLSQVVSVALQVRDAISSASKYFPGVIMGQLGVAAISRAREMISGPQPEGPDPASFEAQTRAVLDSINARVEANRKLAASEAATSRAGGGFGRARGSSADTEAKKAADDRAKSIQQIIESLREQAATEGMTAEQVALYRLAQLGANDATIARAQALVGEIQRIQSEAEALEENRQVMEEHFKAVEAEAEARRELRASDEATLMALADEIRLLGMSARERAQDEAVRRLSIEATDEQREAVRALSGALYDANEAARQVTDEMSAFAEQAARNMQDAFADFLFDPFQGGLEGMLFNFVQVIRQMTSEALAANIFEAIGAEGALKGLLTLGSGAEEAAAAQQAAAAAAAAALTTGGATAGTAITTGGATAGATLTASGTATAASIVAGAQTAAAILSAAGASGSTGGVGGLLSGLFHSGGVVGGAAGAVRSMPAITFAGAPRLHAGGIAGLAADEMPAILRRNEEVLTRNDPRHRYNGGGGQQQPVTIKNINLFDTQAIGDYLATAEGEKVVLNIVSRNRSTLGGG